MNIAVLVAAIAMLAFMFIATWRVRAAPAPNEPEWMRNARIRAESRLTPRWVRWLGATAFVMFFIGIAMFFVASSENPRHPDRPTGHVYPLNNHGLVVYVTRADYFRINGMM
jgi:hypothetical protein